MNGRIRFRHLLIGGVVGVLGGYIILGGYENTAEFIRAEIGRNIQKGAEAMYFPAFARINSRQEGTVTEWVAEQAMQMTPLGNYVKANEVSETQAEDAETYEMLLQKEAEDENVVDENGKLVEKIRKQQQNSPMRLRFRALLTGKSSRITST